jgi:hypothetical protein
MKAITTKYHQARYRYSASDADGNRVYVHKKDGFNEEQNHAHAAKKLCDKMNWRGTLIGSWLKPGVWVWVWLRTVDPVSGREHFTADKLRV